MKRRPAHLFKRARVYPSMLRQNAGAMLKPSPVLVEVPPVGFRALASRTTTGPMDVESFWMMAAGYRRRLLPSSGRKRTILLQYSPTWVSQPKCASSCSLREAQQSAVYKYATKTQ